MNPEMLISLLALLFFRKHLILMVNTVAIRQSSFSVRNKSYLGEHSFASTRWPVE